MPELLHQYRSWIGDASASLPDLVPLGDLDAYEDEFCVVNRLFWAAPSFAGGTLRLFLFFEENIFSKDLSGDLELISSAVHICDP